MSTNNHELSKEALESVLRGIEDAKAGRLVGDIRKQPKKIKNRKLLEED